MINGIFAIAFVAIGLAAGGLLSWYWSRRSIVERERLEAAVARLHEGQPQIATMLSEIRALKESPTFALRLPVIVPDDDRATIDVATTLRAIDDRLSELETGLQALHQAEATKMKRTDATALLERIATLEAAIAAIPKPDLSSITRRIDETQALVRAIEIPEPVDLKGVHRQLGAIQDTLQGIRIPEAPDIKPLQKQIMTVQETVGQIHIPDPPDLKPLQKQVASVEGAVHKIHIPTPPDPVDITPLRDKVGILAARVDAIRIPPPPDLTPVLGKLSKVEDAIQAIKIPEPPPPTDVSPLVMSVRRLEQAVAHLPPPPDLTSMKRKLSDIEERVATLPIPDPIDLKPLQKQVSSVKEAIYDIRGSSQRPQDVAPDEAGWAPLADDAAAPPEPILEQLTRVETMLSEALSRPAPATNHSAAPAARPESEPQLFESAEAGPADDLKQIVGIGPKLERLLNRLGVWYFWQIAQWTPEEINYIDRHLESFKGRIRRNDWVQQATELSAAQPQPQA